MKKKTVYVVVGRDEHGHGESSFDVHGVFKNKEQAEACAKHNEECNYEHICKVVEQEVE